MTLTPDLATGITGHQWLTDHSWSRPMWTIAELEAAKAGRTVSVVLPALNEEDTVGSVVETIAPLLGGLIDELIVLKTTHSEFHGFPRDRYTTLQETTDRVLATEVAARWRHDGAADFDTARRALVESR